MEEAPPTETIELEHNRFISLEFSRRWPQFVVEWSVRQHSGDFDFPLASNTLERPPAPVGGDPASLWDELREEALGEARQAVERLAPPERRSILARLFGRG